MVKSCFFVGATVFGGLLGELVAVGLESSVPLGPVAIGAVAGAVFAAYRLGTRSLNNSTSKGLVFLGGTVLGGSIGFLIAFFRGGEGSVWLIAVGALVGALYSAFRIGSGALSEAAMFAPSSQYTTVTERPPLGFVARINLILICIAIAGGITVVFPSVFYSQWMSLRNEILRATGVQPSIYALGREFQRSEVYAAGVVFTASLVSILLIRLASRKIFHRG